MREPTGLPPIHVLPDVLQIGLRIVFCGTAVGDKSAQAGAYYAGPGNRFWATLHAVGLTPRQLAPAEFQTLLTFGVGLTDIVKCRSGGDDILLAADFDVSGFRAKIERFAPSVIAFNGKRSAAVFNGCRTDQVIYGREGGTIGQTAVWVLPSTSGAARGYWDVEPWRALAASVT